MMNTTWSHLAAATALALMALIVHVLLHNDNNTKALDTARYYTLRRVPGDVAGARALLEDDSRWPAPACLDALNTTNATHACLAPRRALRNQILQRMGCFEYNSQVCTYLRALTAGIIQNRTLGASNFFQGRSLSGAVPAMGTLTYRQLLRDAIGKAPLLFRASFKAAQDPDFFSLRSAMYMFVAACIFANLLVHVLDQLAMTWTHRLAMRLTVFLVSTLVPALILLIGSMGAATTVLVLVWLPAVLVLFYYEAFLDASITRPFVHPFAFAVIYASVSVLALTESAVLNWVVIAVAILQAHAVSFLYMQVVWYWVGYNEKLTHDPTHAGGHAAELYTTREMQYALLLALVAVAVIPLAQALGPFDYDGTDPTLRAAPLVFLLIAVAGTLYVQAMPLDEYYGREKDAEPQPPPPPAGADAKHFLLVWHATRLTGGKLAVSLLLLVFGVLYEFNILGLYFRTLRAYADRLPERAWQLDAASQFTLGTGFLPAPTLYL